MTAGCPIFITVANRSMDGELSRAGQQIGLHMLMRWASHFVLWPG